MSFTIIKGLSLPEPKKSFKKGSKFDAVISSLDVGDCVKFKGQANGISLGRHYYIWRTA